MSLLSATILLVLVMDGLGDIPLFLAALRHVPTRRWRRVIVREMLFAWGVLVAFLLSGRAILSLLDVSERSLSIAGGIVLFLIALRMVFPASSFVADEELPAGEPFLVPLAIPYVAGPSALSTVMLIMSRDPVRWPVWLLAVTLASAVTCALLLSAPWIRRLLGDPGLKALERLMGLVLTTLAVEMFLKGVAEFMAALPG